MKTTQSHTTNVNKLLHERQKSRFYGVMKENQATPPMLVIKHRSGNETAYGYHFLSKRIDFNPSKGIQLTFADSENAETVMIEGQNLLPLWEALTAHRVTFICELADEFDVPEDGELCVSGVSLR